MENNTIQTLVDHLKFLSGSDTLTDEQAIRLLNFAVDDYSYIAITSSGRAKFDANTNSTYPRATTTLSSGSVEIDNTFLAVNKVKITVNGKKVVLQPLDSRDYKDTDLSAEFSGTGVPKYYDWDANGIFVYPTPDTSYTMEIEYTRAHPRYSTSSMTASVGIPSIHEEYLVIHALHKLAVRNVDTTTRAEMRNEKENFEKRIRDFYSKRDQDTVQQLTGSVPSVFMRGRNNKY